jgi:hypothetical protein
MTDECVITLGVQGLQLLREAIKETIRIPRWKAEPFCNLDTAVS